MFATSCLIKIVLTLDVKAEEEKVLTRNRKNLFEKNVSIHADPFPCLVMRIDFNVVK